MSSTRRKLTKMEKAVGKNLLSSVISIPQTTGFGEFNVDEMVQLKGELKSQGKRVSYTALFVKAIALTLKEFPMFNCRLEGEEVVEYESINVGIGIDTPKGLIVAVIKDTQNKTLLEIAEALNDVVDRAREGKLTMDDMTGSTVTISNLIGTKTIATSSIVNNNEAVIFGLCDIRKAPVVDENDQIVIQNVMNICINANHTLINGMDSVRMGVKLREIVEHPKMYLL